MNAATLSRSSRLQATLLALTRAGARGLTTHALADATGSMACHSDVSELRANGIAVTCVYEGRTHNGRKIYRYTIQ